MRGLEALMLLCNISDTAWYALLWNPVLLLRALNKSSKVHIYKEKLQGSKVKCIGSYHVFCVSNISALPPISSSLIPLMVCIVWLIGWLEDTSRIFHHDN